MGSASERFNPGRWKREARQAAAYAYEKARWEKLTPEEQQAELEQKEQHRLAMIEKREQDLLKEARRIEKYQKIASSITVEDFFKSAITLEAKVKAFCSIRGYSSHQTLLTLRSAKATNKLSCLNKVEVMQSYFNILFHK